MAHLSTSCTRPRSRRSLAIALAVVLFGCKGGGKGGAPAVATGDGEATAAATAPSCGSGETGNPSPAFCYRLPAGMKQKGDPVRKKGRFQLIFEGDGGAKLSFIVWGPDAFDATWKALKGNADGSKATDAKEQELDGGKARLLTYTTPGASGRAILSYVARGARHTFECEAETPKGKPGDELLAACKNLHDP